MFFTPRAIEDDIADWVEDRFAILLEHFSADKPVRETTLVLATDINAESSEPEVRAEQIYRSVASHAGFADWPVNLVVMGDEGPKDLTSGVIIQSRNTAAGTFRMTEEGNVEISFARDLLKRPVDLVATFAHELAHLLLHDRAVEEGMHTEDAELVTDLVAVYLGFGVFLSNSAFELEQFQDGLMAGWASRRQGYLSENTLVYATALFCAIKDDGFDEARDGLKPRLQSVFDKALKQIAKRGDRMGLYELDRNPPVRET
jgi:hypothetical protein